jgi:hypothetical protein
VNDQIVKKITRCQIGMTVLCHHIMKYFRTSRSVKKPFPFHEMVDFTKWLRNIYIYNVCMHIYIYRKKLNSVNISILRYVELKFIL